MVSLLSSKEIEGLIKESMTALFVGQGMKEVIGDAATGSILDFLDNKQSVIVLLSAISEYLE